jgi:two-component system sensor histidine kinase BaeS
VRSQDGGGPGGHEDWRVHWELRERAWREQRGRRRQWRRGRRGLPPLGCLVFVVLAFLTFVGTSTLLAVWLLTVVLGILVPWAAPSVVQAIAVGAIVLGALFVAVRAFMGYVRPLADLADASNRLADGEPDVRVAVRGPRPVRNLGASFNAMAERLDRSRDDRRSMLADVTHELRTPLTVVSGGLEAMLDGVHPADEDHLSPLLAETVVMNRLLDDLRTLSLAEAGALPLHREPSDLRAVADDVVASAHTLASAKGVAVTADGDAQLVTSVDPVRVREILANLVANAVRHTPAGGRVTVTVRASGSDAVLDVADTGEGIRAEDLERVFERYHRRSDTGGSGLGLAIVRDLAGAHGGSVEVASDGVSGRGSRFRVRLPLRD